MTCIGKGDANLSFSVASLRRLSSALRRLWPLSILNFRIESGPMVADHLVRVAVPFEPPCLQVLASVTAYKGDSAKTTSALPARLAVCFPLQIRDVIHSRDGQQFLGRRLPHSYLATRNDA